jgi:ferredoxin
MCNTCHVMIPPQYFNKLPQPFEDEKEELEGNFNYLNLTISKQN